MPVVRCRMTDCVNWDEGYCAANRINVDDEGLCLTYSAYDENIEELDDEEDWEDDVEDDEEEAEVLLEVESEDDLDEDVLIRGRRLWENW